MVRFLVEQGYRINSSLQERTMEQNSRNENRRQQAAAALVSAEPSSEAAPKKNAFILVVTRKGHMTEAVMDYAIGVAGRLQYGILVVHIDTLPFFGDGGRRHRLFSTAVQESTAILREKAKSRNVHVDHHEEMGKIGAVVNRLCHCKKHIEFVVIDQGIRLEEVSKQSPVPVFRVITTDGKNGQISKTTSYKTKTKGVQQMSTTSKKRHVKNCFFFGALTVGLYAAVFTHQQFVMTYFTKGGLFALLPVAVVFAVSYAHGNFTSSFWSALGIEGSRMTAAQRAEMERAPAEAAQPRKVSRPRAQLSV